jgi:hypothetical protein
MLPMLPVLRWDKGRVMKYFFTPPQSTFWETITLSLPGNTAMAVPADPERWEQRSGRVVATYTRGELEQAVRLALEQKRVALRARMERGLEVLEAATGCDDGEAERLLEHWGKLDAEHDHVVAALG